MIVDTETGEVLNKPLKTYEVVRRGGYENHNFYHRSSGSRLRTVFSTQGFHLIFGILMLILILSSYSQTLKTGQTVTVPLEGYLRSLSNMRDTDIFSTFLNDMETIGKSPSFEMIKPDTPWQNFVDGVASFLRQILRISFFIPEIIIRAVNLLITVVKLVIITFPI